MRTTLVLEPPTPLEKPGREKYTTAIIEQAKNDLLDAARKGKNLQVELDEDDTATGIKALFGQIAKEEGIDIRFHTLEKRARTTRAGNKVQEPCKFYVAIRGTTPSTPRHITPNGNVQAEEPVATGRTR